jgi:hypothetical protein
MLLDLWLPFLYLNPFILPVKKRSKKEKKAEPRRIRTQVLCLISTHPTKDSFPMKLAREFYYN